MKIEFFQKDGVLDNRALDGGVYVVDLIIPCHEDRPIHLYVGEASCVVKRGGQHLLDFSNNPRYFGLLPCDMDSDMLLRFSLYEPIETMKARPRDSSYENPQLAAKKLLQPLTQVDSESSDHMLGNIDKKVQKVQSAIYAIENT